jgi:hypothetical protein
VPQKVFLLGQLAVLVLRLAQLGRIAVANEGPDLVAKGVLFRGEIEVPRSLRARCVYGVLRARRREGKITLT